MLVTNLRESRPKVDYRVPEAARAERLEKKSLVTTIYVGRAAAGDVPGAVGGFCIQLNDKKVDGDAPMGLVADVKEALRRAGALNVSYSAREAEADEASAD